MKAREQVSKTARGNVGAIEKKIKRRAERRERKRKVIAEEDQGVIEKRRYKGWTL